MEVADGRTSEGTPRRKYAPVRQGTEFLFTVEDTMALHLALVGEGGFQNQEKYTTLSFLLLGVTSRGGGGGLSSCTKLLHVQLLGFKLLASLASRKV